MGLLSPGPGGSVYILAPHQAASGGPEDLHMLGESLRMYGVRANMVYVGSVGKGWGLGLTNGRPADFVHFKVPTAAGVEDTPETVVVIPQTWCPSVGFFKQAKLAIWWLGLQHPPLQANLDTYFAGHADLARRATHLCQSVYAADFLRKYGLSPVMLLDKIAADHVLGGFGLYRANAVAYNPAKGREVTEALMARALERKIPIEWAALANMTQRDMITVLNQAKAYVDFGPHMGMDKIPREAAVAGACVITGMQGAAGVYRDYPLPSEFVFDDRAGPGSLDLDAVLDKILDCLLDYKTQHAKQVGYRAWVRSQLLDFEDRVRELFL